MAAHFCAGYDTLWPERRREPVAQGKYEYWLTPEGLVLLQGWARDGLSEEQISHNMGVSASTLRVWKGKFPALSAALKKGKEVVDREVENALLKRAKGYSYTETRIEESDKDGTKVIKIVKHVPPDVGAAAFWLKNRRRDKYRDRWPDLPADDSDVQTGCVILPEVTEDE